MRTAFGCIVVLLAFTLGCAVDEPEPNPTEPRFIGPQFWIYDLDEYELADYGITYGLGGRWISVRYVRRGDAATTKQEVMARITTALDDHGWFFSLSPIVNYPGKKWDDAREEITFKRLARDNEPQHWFLSQQINVNQDASVLVIYAEVGW